MSVALGTTPEGAVVAPAAPQADPALLESIRSQVVKEIFGDKYQGDFNKAKAGYWNQNQYIGQLETLVSNKQAPTADTNDPFKRISDETLMPMDAFMDAVNRLVDKRMDSVFTPLTGAIQARETMIAQIPQYAQHEQKVLAWADSNPEIANRVKEMNAAGFSNEALSFQYGKFLQANPRPSTPPVDPRSGLPGQPGSGDRNPQTGPTAEEKRETLKNALAYALSTKNENPLWNEVFSDFKLKLPPGFQQGN